MNPFNLSFSYSTLLNMSDYVEFQKPKLIPL